MTEKAQTKFDATTDIDFVVVGTGASGGVIAKELSVAGYRVLALEQGPYLKERDFAHDELKYVRQWAVSNNYKRQPNTFRSTDKEKAKAEKSMKKGQQKRGQVEA